jgi:glycosyltransferase involved in cell wall biosynthesis
MTDELIERGPTAKENCGRQVKSGKKVRILYVHNSADFYGASRSLLRLVKGLDRTRFEPLVMLPETGPLRALLEQCDVPVFIMPSLAIVDRFTSKISLLFSKLPASVYLLVRFIREQQIDLVHTNTGVIISPGLAAKLTGKGHIWHVRESFQEFSLVLWKLYSAYMRFVSDRIICVSNAVAGQFSARKKVCVVHNGFSLAEFAIDEHSLRQNFRGDFAINQTEFLVACIGRIKWGRKGQEFLIKSAAIARGAGKPFTVLLVGAASPGNEEHVTKLRALVEELKLHDKVVFTGELPDTRPAFAAADVVVLPSAHPEPFAGVVMEAMAMGKPVIATALGGCLDQIIPGKTGYLVSPADADALAEKISSLHDEAGTRRRMGEAGRERIRTHFNLSRMLEQIESVYFEVLTR